MSALRFFAIVLVFGAVSVAWMLLAGSTAWRTSSMDETLSAELASRWGPKVVAQQAPYFAGAGRGRDQGVPPAGSTLTADIRHDNRYMGLLWYSTFTVSFRGQYAVPAGAAGAEATKPAGRTFCFPLPPGATGFDELAVSVDETPVPVPTADVAQGQLAVPLPAGARTVTVTYKTNGQDVWLYAPSSAPAGGRAGEHDRGSWRGGDDAVFSSGGPLSELKDFSLAIRTDFTAIDYPKGTRSPTEPAQPIKGGMEATWRFASGLTNQAMGVVMPRRQQPGPIVTRMSLFAPVSLFFFFTVLFVVVVLKGIGLHPMHYLFLSAGFFAFHILLAYLGDLVNIHTAFWISAAVSVLLVTSYMRLVAGAKFALLVVGLAQLVFLVGFSYAFFFKGYTGLAVVIGAILTLLLLMQATGRVNWHEVFARRNSQPPAPLPPAPPPA